MHLDHFSFLAPIYDRLIKYSPSPSLNRIAGLPTGGRLLDAGGGTGRVSGTLRDLAGQILVADLSTGMLKQAAAKDLQTACARTERLPFPSASFERILMVDALHHVCSQNETARELWRVLTPGGRIVILEPDIHNFAVKLIALFEKATFMRSRFISGAQIANLFSFANGTAYIEYEGYNVWVVIEKEKGSLRKCFENPKSTGDERR
ncbi:MAG: class I SAM-dependent methyltransferase [Chloroflexi bacterium]|nr:class I SAM-dependent methyltransferase [Chloroflexota bacterium]